METTDTAKAGTETTAQSQLYKWQNKLLPWLIILPTILILLFLYLATQQVNHFNEAINQKSQSITEGMHMNDTGTIEKMNSNMEYLKWVTLAKMEEESVNKRYHQGGLLLLSRIFIKYLGFLTGMIIAIVGAVFIIAKLSEAPTNAEGTIGEKVRISIASSSPGVIFGILGTVLMVSTILQHNEIEIKDSPLYLNPYNVMSIKSSGASSLDSASAANGKIDSAKAAILFQE